MPGSTRRTLAAVAVLGLTASGCATAELPSPRVVSTRSAGFPATAPAAGQVTTVFVVSLDGLNPESIRELGAQGAPTMHRLIDEGASTLNARSEREQTQTLPNHTGMLTGRRITASAGGHGVTWNDERLEPPTVQAAAGRPVSSVFSVVDSPDRDTAMFASKQKFSLFERSWDQDIDRFVIRGDNAALVRQVRRDIADKPRSFRFVHLSKPDIVGHAHGFMSADYLAAVEDTDRMLGRILATIEDDAELVEHTVLIVTSDHGGRGIGHKDPTRLADYRVPFIVWGSGVAAGADLYDLNPDYADPGRKRTSYASDEQPVRNGAVANVVTDLLGLPRVPGSEHDAAQDLDVD